MPSVAVASGDTIGCCGAMVDGEGERNGAVAALAVEGNVLQVGGGCRIGGAMPGEAVAGGQVFRGCTALALCRLRAS